VTLRNFIFSVKYYLDHSICEPHNLSEIFLKGEVPRTKLVLGEGKLKKHGNDRYYNGAAFG